MDVSVVVGECICQMCKRPLLVELAMPSRPLIGVREEDGVDDSAYSPIAYYFGCKHWIHQHCVRDLLVHPSTRLCGDCVSKSSFEMHASNGVLSHSIKRLQGIEQEIQLTSQSSMSNIPAHVRVGTHHAYDIGDNFLINAATRGEIAHAEKGRFDQERRENAEFAKDEEMFDETNKIIMGALHGDFVAALPEDTQLARKDTQTQRELLGAFFNDDQMSLWSFIDRDGRISALILMGATWDQLCSWGLSELRATDVGFGRNNTRTLWPGHDCVPRLCAQPISMNFLMFFTDVCKSNFDILGQLMIPATHLEKMRFSFNRHGMLFLREPRKGLAAMQYLTAEICVRKFHLTRKMLNQLRERDSSPEMATIIETSFNSWQLV